MNGEKRTYKWLVLFTACICNGLTWGLLYSVGVLYKYWIRYFTAPASYVSFAGGLPTAVGCVAGPVYGYLVDRFGIRKTGIVGGILTAIGMSVSCFVNSVTMLCVTFGLIAGFGAGMANFTGCGIINDYFVQNRLLAEGLMGGGLCAGNFLLSLLQQYLGNLYSWRGAMLITGAICLHLSLCAFFFVPSNLIGDHPLNFWKSFDEKKKKRREIQEQEHDEDEASDESAQMTRLAEVGDKKNPDFDDIHTETISRPGFFRRSLTLWQNPIYIMIMATDFLTWLAIFIPYVHLVERGRLEGLDGDTAAWLSSTIGLAGIVGRPITGVICNMRRIDPFWSYCGIQMLCGAFTFLSSFWNDVTGLFAFAVVFGFFSNGYGLIKASSALLLGPECFVDGFSWMLLFEGIGIVFGPSFAGFIYDATGSYKWSFRFSGCLVIAAAMICFLRPAAVRWQRRREESKRRFAAASRRV